jgi:hypothetical protein
MSINASIIDQRLVGIQDEIRGRAVSELGVKNDEVKLKSIAFVYLTVRTMLDLDKDEAFDCVTDRSRDFGVDAMHITEDVDGEFGVTIFQAKYKTKLYGTSNFEESGIDSLINAIKYIFDPYAILEKINDRLAVKVEEVRSMIRDGHIPRVRAIACSNSLHWNDAADEAIKRAAFGDQVSWEYVNHDTLLGLLQRIKHVDATLKLTGKVTVEDMNYSRVCVGRVPVSEIANLMKMHGERLLERNIRRYLGLHGNRVNESIRKTLISPNPENFYFFNNGLTLVCDDFSYNALQSSDFQVKIESLQIVNGGQTCMTIFKTSEELAKLGQRLPSDATVLVRLYKLPKDDEEIFLQITHATNSQNPVDLKDLKSNDDKQKQLEGSIQDLGFIYRRKRAEGAGKPSDITPGVAAEALLSVWRQAPHQAKFFAREHFGKLYSTIFRPELNGAQVITSVLIYRIAENHRRRPAEGDPIFVRYASCFIAMRMGVKLLKEMKINVTDLDHRNFPSAREKIEQQGERYFNESVKDVQAALKRLYGETEISMQQLSATFRRGDLVSDLQIVDLFDELDVLIEKDPRIDAFPNSDLHR